MSLTFTYGFCVYSHSHMHTKTIYKFAYTVKDKSEAYPFFFFSNFKNFKFLKILQTQNERNFYLKDK